jgi:hypothetical protein
VAAGVSPTLLSHPSDALDDEGCGRGRAQSAPFVDHVGAGLM